MALDVKTLTQEDLDAVVAAKDLAEAKLADYEGDLKPQVEAAEADVATKRAALTAAEATLAGLQAKLALVTVPKLELGNVTERL